MSKASRKQGAEVLSEKKYPLPVNGLHSGLKTGHRGASLWKRFASAPQVFLAFAAMGKPRLLSAAKENGEGARLPHVKSLKKTRG